jgi:hypothetical protein
MKGLDTLRAGIGRVISRVRRVTDTVIDSAIDSGARRAEEKLTALNKQWRGNFLKTLCFDGAFIAVAAASIAARAHWTLPVLYAIGAAKLLWTLRRAVRLYGALRPHKEVIMRFAPETLGELWRTLSPRLALMSAIRRAFRYYYGEKLTPPVKTAHDIAARIGAVSDAREVEDKIAEKLYPPLSRYLHELLVVNVLCFAVFYGILAALVKAHLMRLAGG